MVESEGEGESVAAGSDCVFAGGVSGECDGGLFGVSVGDYESCISIGSIPIGAVYVI